MNSRVKQARVWQRMLSGRRLDLLEPSPLDVEIEDIAHGLARVARWNGQTTGKHAFSVAQHSVLVCQIFQELAPASNSNERLTALLHDAPEYVIGDMISPFKAILGDEYKEVEARLQEAIHLRFGLPASIPGELKAQIKKADTVCAYFEATELAGFEQTEARKLFGIPRGFKAEQFALEPLPADDAQNLFIEAFCRIENSR